MLTGLLELDNIFIDAAPPIEDVIILKIQEILQAPAEEALPAGSDDDSVEWVEGNFYIPELRGPITLAPYQRAVLREAHRRDSRGRFIYNMVLWSDIKKSAKSSIAAAVALYRATKNDWASVKIIANDLKQADSRVASYLRRAIRLNPVLKQKIKQVLYKTILPNDSIIEAIPLDPGGEAGGNDDLIVFSELWAAKNKAATQMWTELTLSPLKFGNSQRWVETYAGHVGESPLLEPLYERAVKEENRLDLSYTDGDGTYHDLSDLEVYADGDMLCLWNTKPRLAWQTPEYYASEAETLLPDEFDRIHRNKWISSSSKFVPDEWWEACKGPLPAFQKSTSMTLAADAGVSSDCVALVGVSGQYVRYARKWVAPSGGKIDFLGTVENPGLEREIVRLCFLYNVTEFRYDPYQMHDMAVRLAKGVPVDGAGNIVEKSRAVKILRINVVEFLQGAPRAKADKQLYDRIRDRSIVHSGDPDLSQDIQNANAKTEGEQMRLVKRAIGKKIDLAVALSMASFDMKAKSGVKVAGAW